MQIISGPFLIKEKFTPYYCPVSEEILERTHRLRGKREIIFMLQLSLWAAPGLLSASVPGPEEQIPCCGCYKYESFVLVLTYEIWIAARVSHWNKITASLNVSPVQRLVSFLLVCLFFNFFFTSLCWFHTNYCLYINNKIQELVQTWKLEQICAAQISTTTIAFSE